MKFDFKVEAGDFTNAGTASSEIKKILKQLNIDTKIIKRIVVAMYEAEVNIVAHSYGGEIIADIDTDRILVKFEDSGPGIPDIEKAMEIGFSTASQKVREMGFGAGMGLPNIKKNVDELDLSSVVGEGTTLTMTVNF
ncbi:MAG: anti-sigma regulatory factor [Bacteroidales bacterium]|nr:anti-sigma regulatory factor [Bacteroidales bacterium]